MVWGLFEGFIEVDCDLHHGYRTGAAGRRGRRNDGSALCCLLAVYTGILQSMLAALVGLWD